MPVQDDVRERHMVALFNLDVPQGRQRSDIDAHLQLEELSEPLPFELKSTTKKSVSTVRDFGPEHIAKWRDLHWLFAFYTSGNDPQLQYCSYASPTDMAPWIEEKQQYVLPDLVLAERVPQQVTEQDLYRALGAQRDAYTTADAKRIMKKQWTAKRYKEEADLPRGGYSRDRMLEVLRDRCNYVIRRGATLNNPHISAAYLKRLTPIERDHAATLRRLVRNYLETRQQAEDRGEVTAAPLDPIVAAQANAAETDEATA